MKLETLKCDSHVQNDEAVASSCLLSHDTCLLGEDVYTEHPRTIVFCSGSTCFSPAQTQLTEAAKFQSRRLVTVTALNSIQETNHAVEGLQVEANQLGC